MSLLYKKESDLKYSVELKTHPDGKVVLKFSADCGKFGTDELFDEYEFTVKELLSILQNQSLWPGWISTEKESPSDEMDGEQILMRLDYQQSGSVVLCGVWKNGQFHCLDTDDVYENVVQWAYLPTYH
jgi:hypothetical protein